MQRLQSPAPCVAPFDHRARGAAIGDRVSTFLLPAPTLVTVAGPKAQACFWEYFVAQIRNPHTRRAYSRAVRAFLTWCAAQGVTSVARVKPLHIGAYLESLNGRLSPPTIKLQLAALRALFEWLVLGHVIRTNPAANVRGPRYSARIGKTPVLDALEARRLLDSIDIATPIGLRDHALIAPMVYSFARIGAAIAMRVEDVFVEERRLWVRLREKGGKRHQIPCHHNLEAYLYYIERCGLAADPTGPLFPTINRSTRKLSITPLPQANAYQMVRRRAAAAGIATKIGNHTFRATGITTYLQNGGTLEKAAVMANHASIRTTQLYDRRRFAVSLDEVERVVI